MNDFSDEIDSLGENIFCHATPEELMIIRQYGVKGVFRAFASGGDLEKGMFSEGALIDLAYARAKIEFREGEWKISEIEREIQDEPAKKPHCAIN